jgi:hypothetical protein
MQRILAAVAEQERAGDEARMWVEQEGGAAMVRAMAARID